MSAKEWLHSLSMRQIISGDIQCSLLLITLSIKCKCYKTNIVCLIIVYLTSFCCCFLCRCQSSCAISLVQVYVNHLVQSLWYKYMPISDMWIHCLQNSWICAPGLIINIIRDVHSSLSRQRLSILMLGLSWTTLHCNRSFEMEHSLCI